MPNKTKLKLNDLEVKSFETENKQEKVLGGATSGCSTNPNTGQWFCGSGWICGGTRLC